MKAIKTGILFILAVLLLNGCVKEDLDDCPDDPEYNLVLLFEYFDPAGKDIFTDRLETIDVFLYNEEGTQYNVYAFDEVISSTDRKKELWVEPGIYYVVSWANKITQRDLFTYPSVSINLGYNYLYHTDDKSTDQLHYAPDLREIPTRASEELLTKYRVEVTRTKTTYYTVSYMSAHRTLNIYLKGFYELDYPEVANPTISARRLSQYYDDYLVRGSRNMTLSKSASEVTVRVKGEGDSEEVEEIRGYSQFYVPHFDNDSDVTIEISGFRQHGDPYVYPVTMNDILKELELVVWDGDDAVIDIEIELINDAWVTINVPAWLVKDVEGEFNGDE